MSDLYSQLKVLHHHDRLMQLRLGQPVAPVHVQLILSDLCNQDCSFCAYRMSGGLTNELFPDAEGHHNPNRQIPTEKAEAVLRECAALGVKAIQFTGGGEPTVHPEHRYLFQLAQSLGLETGLVTNGVKLDPHDPAVLGLAWVRVSVDAGDAETYAAVRRVPAPHWGKVWANVAALAANYRGRLGVGYVATPDNRGGIVKCAALAKGAGASYVRIGAVFSALGSSYYSPSAVQGISKEVGKAKAQLDGDGFEVVDLFDRRLGELDAGHPNEPFCGYQRMTWYIGGDLTVYRCCNTAYTRAGAVGSLHEHTLTDLMNTQAHEPFDARGCRHCQFLGQNRAIAAALNPPEHVNFV